MGRKNRPWVVLLSNNEGVWWPRQYFDDKESAENYAINNSIGNNKVFRVEKNSPTNPSIFKTYTNRSVETTPLWRAAAQYRAKRKKW